MTEAAAIAVIRLALRALAERILSMMALAMTFGLACWAMYDPNYQRNGMAAFFAVAVFLPCVWRDRRKQSDESSQL